MPPDLLFNEISGRIWNLFIPDESPVKPGRVFIQSISWQGYADPDHHVLVTDHWGNTIFESYGHTDLDPIEIHFAEPISILDLTLVDIGSGRVCVAIA